MTTNILARESTTAFADRLLEDTLSVSAEERVRLHPFCTGDKTPSASHEEPERTRTEQQLQRLNHDLIQYTDHLKTSYRLSDSWSSAQAKALPRHGTFDTSSTLIS